MDLSQLNMNDPQIQALVAEFMRKQQQGGGVAPPAVPQAPQAPGAVPPGAAPAAVLQNGPAPAGPTPPPGPSPAGPGGPPGAPPGAAQLDPSMVEGVLGLQGQRGQREGLERQYALADAMRADSKGQLQQRIIPSSTGGMVVAPSWANGAVSLGQNIMAERRTRDADAKGAKLDSERQRVQKGYFDQLTGQMRKRDPRDDLGGWGSLADY